MRHRLPLSLPVLTLLLAACASGKPEPVDTPRKDPAPQVDTTPAPKDMGAPDVAPPKDVIEDVAKAPPQEPEPPKPLEHLVPLNPRSIAMERACEEGERVTIGALGDVLLHIALQRQAMTHPDRFRSLWSDFEDVWGKLDLVYANLEGPTAYGVVSGGRKVKDPGFKFDQKVYSSYPRFNYHPTLIEDLKKSGIDVVSTANNHSLDRSGIGVDRTIEMLDKYGMPYFGTRRSDHKKKEVRGRWHTITEVNGIRIAWVACTFSTNGLPDYKDQVLFCYEDRKEFLDTVRTLSKDTENVDIVLTTPHWGWEYTQNLRRQQVQLAKDIIEAGAAAVIGGHPHVIQKWMKHKAKDGREGFILFSLGNFVSNMDELDEKTAIMLVLGLTKPKDGGKVFVNGVRHVPLYMYSTRERKFARTIERGAKKDDALHHVLDLFGTYNMQSVKEEIDTTPQCRQDWVAPTEWHPTNGWMGGACDTASACGDEALTCDTAQPQGMCTMACQESCPDRKGHKPTICVGEATSLDRKAPALTEGTCRIRCRKDLECRPGYVCGKRVQTGSKKRVQRVCVPAPVEEKENASPSK